VHRLGFRGYKFLIIIASCLLYAKTVFPKDFQSITSVRTQCPFFNPSLKETCDVQIEVSKSGQLTAEVLDRDGFVVRQLFERRAVSVGLKRFQWDGKNNRGAIVPDEAYSLKIELYADGSTDIYFPGNRPAEIVKPEIQYYDRQNGVLKYSLEKPSRVHAQTGCAKVDPINHVTRGPVMKTLVNREPRAAGSIVENWNGYDESNTIYVPDLPNFVTSIAAESLPENAMITIGNRLTSFIAWIAERRGQSLFTYHPVEHHHHRGLSAAEDISPKLSLTPVNAKWDRDAKAWVTRDEILQVNASIDGPFAKQFVAQPGSIWVFLDGDIKRKLARSSGEFRFKLRLNEIDSGIHIVSVNWASELGPAAANSFRIIRTNQQGTYNRAP